MKKKKENEMTPDINMFHIGQTVMIQLGSHKDDTFVMRRAGKIGKIREIYHGTDMPISVRLFGISGTASYRIDEVFPCKKEQNEFMKEVEYNGV
jgi:hypothetical protein